MKILVYALGGLGENGKNMYVIEADEQIFIFDAGIKYPTSEMFGVDKIIPDYRTLLTRKERIKGIFLTHAHEDHIGAVPHVLKDLQVPVYATHFTMEILKEQLIEAGYNLDEYELMTVMQHSTIKYGNVKITFFKTTHSIPESIGIAVQTLDGTIVYTSDFTFDQNTDLNYQTDYQKIAEIADKDILLLMTESISSGISLDGKMNYMLDQQITQVIGKATDRVIVSLFSSDLLKIQKVIDIALKYDKRIAIIGRKAQRIVDIAIRMNYLTIPEDRLTTLRFIDEKNKNDDPDLVCLVTGDRHEPFHMLNRMVKKADRLIHINENDTILVVTSPIPGTEKMAAKTLDTLYRTDASVHVIDKKYLTFNHATSNEIKLMISLLKPKYIMPVIGEYRMLHQVSLLAKEMGYADNELFILDNGDALRLENQRAIIQTNRFRVGDVLIDGLPVGDINDIVIHDRELLAENGVLIITSHIDPKKREIVGDISIMMKGFVPDSTVKDLEEPLKNLFKETCETYFENNYINWNDLKILIRDEINKFLYKETRRRPITIPVVISTEVGMKE